jgi:hypothetical protein
MQTRVLPGPVRLIKGGLPEGWKPAEPAPPGSDLLKQHEIFAGDKRLRQAPGKAVDASEYLPSVLPSKSMVTRRLGPFFGRPPGFPETPGRKTIDTSTHKVH